MTATISVSDEALAAPAAKVTVRQVMAGIWSWAPVYPMAAVLVVAVIGPWIVPLSPTAVAGSPNLPPGGAFHFGTDSTGLDVFSRTIAAFRNDIVIATLTSLISTTTGILVGLLIGMNESRRGLLGWVARFLARVLDLIQAVPAVVIALALVAVVGTSVFSLTIALAIILTPNQARMVRTEVLKVRTDAYVDAARMAGESEFALTMRHVLPNASWPALENSSLVFGAAILIAATLGFLGVGLQPPTPEWGSMISTGASDAAVGRWWSFVFPAIALVIAVGSFALAGQRVFGRRTR
jgi:peptide/nickel transport system permease protein